MAATVFRAPVLPNTDDVFRFAYHPDAPDTPIVMVVFDELPLPSLLTPAGHIDRRHFPHFAFLERNALWFRNATTERGFSKEAIPGLLAGTYPEEQLYGYHVMPHNIFTLLGSSYPIVADDELPGLCPPAHCTTRAEENAPLPRLHAFGTSDAGRKLHSFLSLLRPSARPKFHFLHLVFPHGPWIYLPSGNQYEQPVVPPGEVNPPGRGEAWGPDQWLVKQAYQRHLLQVKLADRVLGTILQRLRAKDMYDDALLVVAADHGVAFVPAAPKRALTEKTVGHVAPVPLFFKLPGQDDGKTSDVPARTIDLVPTVADALDLSLPWSDVEGRSLLRPGPAPVRRAGEVVLDPEGSEKFAAVERKYAIFGHTHSGLDFYRLGPARTRHLIGVPVDEFRIRDGGRRQVTVPAARAYETLDPANDWIPALRGVVTGVRPPAQVAVAVNGRVAAITQTYGPSRNGFLAVIPPRYVHPGENHVAFYEITPWHTLIEMRRVATVERGGGGT